MAWDTLFSLTNIWAVCGWLLLIFLPRKELISTVILYLGIASLCLAYTVLMTLLLTNAVDGGGASSGEVSFYSIKGIRGLFASDAGIVIGWIHYLAFDLFVGLWISRDADSKNIHRFVQGPVLLLTFLFGPIGLLTWLIIREPAARKYAKAHTQTD